jgi:preprotein translocase subunit SecG
MGIIISILIVIASVLLILFVLVQNSKGGGLASNFSSSNQMLGVRKTTDALEKGTWYLAIAVLVLAIAASATIKRGEGTKDSLIKDKVQNTVMPTAVPQFPTENTQQPAQPASGETK